jgi:hypothetical protein
MSNCITLRPTPLEDGIGLYSPNFWAFGTRGISKWTTGFDVISTFGHERDWICWFWYLNQPEFGVRGTVNVPSVTFKEFV